MCPGDDGALSKALVKNYLKKETMTQHEDTHETEQPSHPLLQEGRGLYEAIVASSDDAVISKTLDGIVVSWNPAAEHLFGYRAQEAIGKPITLIIPPELHQEEEDILAKLRQGQHIHHYETVRQRKDGTRMEVSLSISPVKDQHGSVIGAAKIARDISERKALERRKDTFLRLASHELKTPMAALKGMAQLLQRNCERQGLQHLLPPLQQMSTQVDRLSRLVDELLDASRLQQGRISYQEERVDLAPLVYETATFLQASTLTHTLNVHTPDHAWVLGDRDRLAQVLINLVSNAIKYSPEAAHVEISLTETAEQVILTVRDSGIGIAKEHQPHLFERFYRVPDSQIRDVAGMGLGLAIVRDIVQRHGGTITVDSKERQGSTFEVSLPRVRR